MALQQLNFLFGGELRTSLILFGIVTKGAVIFSKKMFLWGIIKSFPMEILTEKLCGLFIQMLAGSTIKQ